jgi:integrase
MVRHEILGGLVQLYRRDRSRFWQCSASYKGRQFRASTKEDDLPQAQQFAEDWYLEIRGKARAGLLPLKKEKTFSETAEQFLKEYGTITEGERSKKWVEGHGIRQRLHLVPFFGKLGVSEVTPGKVQEYRVHRMTSPVAANVATDGHSSDPNQKKSNKRPWKAPSRSTLHDEIVTLRLILKTAVRHGWLSHVPDFSPPYKTQGKISHRPWFSPTEYKQLYTATRQYAHDMKDKRHQWNAEQVHDYVLFMANTGLRPDEAMARNLEHRDVTIVKDRATGERILEIEVRGKRGVGYCKSMPSAVRPYERLLERAKPVPQGRKKDRKKLDAAGLNQPPQYPQPSDPVFPGNHIKLFNNLLRRTDLKVDREGRKRTAYSLRHTYICMRLMEGADIYQIAKNCRTSVKMIEKFYAAHIKDLLDTSAINVMRPKAARQPIVLPKNSEGGKSAKRATSPARKRRRQDHREEEIQP